MNCFNKLVVLIFSVCTFSVQADIKVSLHQDLEILVLNNKNVGYTIFDNNEFTLKNGENQIVIRVSKLVIKQGYKEKFKSEPVVLSFNLSDVNVEVTPERSFIRYEEIKGFDKNPTFIVTNNGENISVENALLERGAGMTRDYATELKAYNQENNIVVATAGVSSVSTTTESVKKVPASPIIMSQALFIKANAAEKEQYTDWAFENRKSIAAPLNGEGKILPMLEYWYEKATKDEKAEILTWVLAQ